MRFFGLIVLFTVIGCGGRLESRPLAPNPGPTPTYDFCQPIRDDIERERDKLSECEDAEWRDKVSDE
jgi:hypothetical protein